MISYNTFTGPGLSNTETNDDDCIQENKMNQKHYLLELLSMRNQQHDAKRAVLYQVLGIHNITNLILSKATHDQIASATNDALSDEILATVEPVQVKHCQEDGYHTILELVYALDASTGGFVNRLLTNLRQRTIRNSQNWDHTEYCVFCNEFRNHNTSQHRCRVCGVLGLHRSNMCPNTMIEATSESKLSSLDENYCTFCSTRGFHRSENHRCRICGTIGEHRSRFCPTKRSHRGYRWRGYPRQVLIASPSTTHPEMCNLCGILCDHTTSEHRCRICLQLGQHRSKNCPRDSHPEMVQIELKHCEFCAKDVTHLSEEHICHICRAIGLHRSGDCPSRLNNKAVQAVSNVRDHILQHIPLPCSATSMVLDSIDRVGDADTIVRRTLQRLGVWGGGSQTPITTPYVAHVVPTHESNLVETTRQSIDHQNLYVLFYAEGQSVVPERILKYMRLLMHNEISTNAFSVVVRFDPCSSRWETQRPGMVSPHSVPSSPRMSDQVKKRMVQYTLQTLLSAREKLIQLVLEQKKLIEQTTYEKNYMG